MSEEQLKAAEAEAKAEQEEGSGEEISEEDLAGVAGGFAGAVVATTRTSTYYTGSLTFTLA